MNELSKAEWDNCAAETAKQMADYLKQYVTPISFVISHNEGEHLGSGSYITHQGQHYLLTNEHVVKGRGGRIAHIFQSSENYYLVRSDIYSIPEPTDVAIAEIKDSMWTDSKHNSKGIALSQFALTHSPAKSEILCILGFSGERSRFVFNHLFTASTPFSGQEVDLPEDVRQADKKYHFALDYRPDLATTLGSGPGLPTPPGMSGTLVWDSRRVASDKQGIKWSPDMAKVTGIVWGWGSSSGCLIATKAEHMMIKELILKEYEK